MQDEEKAGRQLLPDTALQPPAPDSGGIGPPLQEARREGHALEEAEEAMVRAARYMNQHYQEGDAGAGGCICQYEPYLLF